VPVPLEPVVSTALGLLARGWFDIPDGASILVDYPNTRETKLSCPFSFLAPSRYVFSSPQPRPVLEQLAAHRGTALLNAVREFVAARRHDVGSLTGTVTPALFASIEDDETLARVLLGLVFGFVPTVHGSILQVLAQWLPDETLWRMQQIAVATAGAPLMDRAKAVRPHIERAMQMRPVPPLLHRTAVEATSLGPVAVEPGDRIVVAIASMTQETLASGQCDVTTIFGGNRDAPHHPTHACPGRDIALGVIHGVLLGILDHAPLTPTAAQFTVRVPLDVALASVAKQARPDVG
jgi:hypothetical protein